MKVEIISVTSDVPVKVAEHLQRLIENTTLGGDVTLSYHLDGILHPAENLPPGVNVTHGSFQGKVACCNRLMMASAADVIVVVDSRLVLLPQARNEWLNTMLKPIIDGQAQVTGAVEINCGAARSVYLTGILCMARQVLVDHGLYDDAFEPCFLEDLDMCLRWQSAGVRMANVNRIVSSGAGLTGCSMQIYYVDGDYDTGVLTADVQGCIRRRNSTLIAQRHARGYYARYNLATTVPRLYA